MSMHERRLSLDIPRLFLTRPLSKLGETKCGHLVEHLFLGHHANCRQEIAGFREIQASNSSCQARFNVQLRLGRHFGANKSPDTEVPSVPLRVAG